MNKEHWKNGKQREPFAQLGEEEIFRLIERKMKVGRSYLDHSLTMESLATELNVYRNTLSAAVNRYAKMSFPLWLTAYRVAEVKRLAASKENQTVSIEELALRAGFTNRNSFYKGFKNIVGITPAEWRKQKIKN